VKAAREEMEDGRWEMEGRKKIENYGKRLNYGLASGNCGNCGKVASNQ